MNAQVQKGKTVKERRPVSRIDSNNTHGWFARVYRAEWVGPRSFADRQYGSPEQAEAAAYKWWELADARLPVIPPKPQLMKATVHLRTDPKEPTRKYYDLYLGTGRKAVDRWSERFYFNVPAQPKTFRRQSEAQTIDFRADDIYHRISGVETIDLKTNEQDVARQKAEKRRDEINARLQAEYRESLAAWYVEHDRLMEQILKMWPDVKGAL